MKADIQVSQVQERIALHGDFQERRNTEQVAKFMYDNKSGEAAIEMVAEFPMTGELLHDIISEQDVHTILHDEFVIITSKAAGDSSRLRTIS